MDYATSDGTAAAGADYTATSGTLNIAQGQRQATIEVPVAADGVAEGGSETFTLMLSNPTADATATGTIDDAAAPHVPDSLASPGTATTGVPLLISVRGSQLNAAGKVTAGEPFTAHFIFHESTKQSFGINVSGFAAGDITVTGGSKGTLTPGGCADANVCPIFVLEVTPDTGATEVVLSVAANAATAVAGQTESTGGTVSGGNRAASLTVPVAPASMGGRRAPPVEADRTAPSAAVTSKARGPVSSEFAVTVTFSEPVTGFRMSELAVTNGRATRMASLVDRTGYAAEHEVYVAPDPDPGAGGEVTVIVPADVATDADGNPNTASATFRIGRSRASNRAEATPEAPEVLDFAHFANGTGITSEMVFVNVAPHPIRPAIYFYNTEGGPIAAESVVDVTGDLEVAEDGALTVQTQMDPLGVLTILTHGQGEVVSGSVKVVSDGPIGGMVRYGVPEIGVAGVGASEPVRDVLFPARRQAGGIRTAAALHNLEEEAMEVSCRLMSGGVALEEAEIPLEANGQTSWFIEDTFTATDTSAFLGSVRCTAPGRGRFTAIAVEMAAAQRIFNTLSVVPVARTGGRRGETVLDFAHFANGTWITDLVFVNLETQPSGPPLTPFHTAIPPTRPAIYFYDTAGNPIAPESVVDITGDLEVAEDGALTVQTQMEPLGVLTISTHGRGPLVSGSVRVVSEGPIGGMLRFEHPALGVAGAGVSPPVSDALFPVRRQEGGITTGVALHNLESSPGLLRCDLMREGVLRDSASSPLAANGQTSWLIDQEFPAADTSDFAGSVRCDAVGEGQFAAVALEMDPATRTFTTLPVVPVPEMPDRE